MSNKTGLLKASLISCALTMALSPAIQAAQDDGRYIIQFKQGHGNSGRGAVNAAGASVALELNNHNAVAAHIPAAALNGLRNNLSRPTLVTVAIFPAARLQASFDITRTPFGEIFLAIFGLLAPNHDPVPLGVFLHFPIAALEAVRCR